MRVLRLGLRRGDDVASLITNSRIGGHAHGGREYSVARIEVSVGTPD